MSPTTPSVSSQSLSLSQSGDPPSEAQPLRRRSSLSLRPLQSSLVVVLSSSYIGMLTALSLAMKQVTVTLIDLSPPLSKTSKLSTLPARDARALPGALVKYGAASSAVMHVVSNPKSKSTDGENNNVTTAIDAAMQGLTIDAATLSAAARAAVKATRNIVVVAAEEVREESVTFAPDGWTRLVIKAGGKSRSLRSKLVVSDGPLASVVRSAASTPTEEGSAAETPPTNTNTIVTDLAPTPEGMADGKALLSKLGVAGDKERGETLREVTINVDIAAAKALVPSSSDFAAKDSFAYVADTGLSLVAGCELAPSPSSSSTTTTNPSAFPSSSPHSRRAFALRAGTRHTVWQCATVDDVYGQLATLPLPSSVPIRAAVALPAARQLLSSLSSRGVNESEEALPVGFSIGQSTPFASTPASTSMGSTSANASTSTSTRSIRSTRTSTTTPSTPTTPTKKTTIPTSTATVTSTPPSPSSPSTSKSTSSSTSTSSPSGAILFIASLEDGYILSSLVQTDPDPSHNSDPAADPPPISITAGSVAAKYALLTTPQRSARAWLVSEASRAWIGAPKTLLSSPLFSHAGMRLWPGLGVSTPPAYKAAWGSGGVQVQSIVKAEQRVRVAVAAIKTTLVSIPAVLALKVAIALVGIFGNIRKGKDDDDEEADDE